MANATQRYRTDLKRGIKDGTVAVAEVLRNPHPLAHKMLVVNVLCAIPRVARPTADRLLRAAGIAQSKTLIGMTPRQVEALIPLLKHPGRFKPFSPMRDPLTLPLERRAA